MRVGNIDGILGMGRFQTVYDSGELSSAQTSLTISNLDGDNDKEYLLICRLVGGATNSYLRLRFNGDTGSNYGQQQLAGQNTTAAAYRGSGTGIILNNSDCDSGEIAFNKNMIYAKSGYVRTLLSQHVDKIATTTVDSIYSEGWSWNNSADNITSIVIDGVATNGIGVGSRIILMKKSDSTSKMKTGTLNVQGKVKGTFQKIYKTTLTGAATSVTISGLDGNTDQLYRIKVRGVGAANNWWYLKPNNDTSCGAQQLYGSGSSASAWRGTVSGFYLTYPQASTYLSYIEGLIYAKSGYIRTFLSNEAEGITGTTINSINLFGQSWNNTADNLTSLVIVTSDTNGLGIGTTIELERYTP